MIESLRECDHAGFFYGDAAQRVPILTRLVQAGLTRHEQTVVIGAENDLEPLRAELAGRLSLACARTGGVLRVLSRHHDLDDPSILVRQIHEDALAAGFGGVRVALDMAWVLGPLVGLERMRAWEEQLHALLMPGCSLLAVCMYDRRRFGATLLAAAINSHPIVILQDQVYPNVYYEPSTLPDRAAHTVGRLKVLTPGAEGAELKILREQAARAEAEATARRAMFLAEASILLTSSLDLDTIFARVSDLAVPALADWCAVHVIAEGREARRVAMANVSPAMRRRAEEMWTRWPLRLDGPHPIATVLRAGEPLVVSHVTDELLADIARDEEHLAALRALGIQSFLVVPLRARQQTLGTIAFASAESGRRYTHQDLEFAEALGRRAALAMDNARLYTLSERRRREAESLAELSHLVSGSLDPTELGRRIADSAHVLLGGRTTSLLRLDPSTGDFVVVAVAGVRGGPTVPGFRIPAGLGLVGLVARQAEPLVTGDVLADDRVRLSTELRGWLERDTARALLVVPMIAKGQMLGVLHVADLCGRVFDADEIRLARSFAAHAAIAEVNSRLYADAEQFAVERERVRMAGELHDTLSQVLFSLGLKLDWCLHRTLAAEVRDKLGEIRRDAGFVMEQIRRLIGELAAREGTGDPLGRLRALLDDFRELTGIVLEDAIEGDLAALEAEQREILGKLVQEALTNVAKHARSKRVWLRIEVTGDAVHFEVADDGVGPQPDDVAGPSRRGNGFGLLQMRERLEAIGGRLEYGPNAPSGFRVWGAFPTAPPR